MNKKGFTLIEIIICISLVAVVGLGSIFTINFVSNKKLITKLNEITEKAVNAAQVYIETNEEANNQLYKNKNGVSLPLQLLVKEGLLNLDHTELTEKDIKDQYVVTFLGSTNSSDNCEQITSTTSWGNEKEIYLCLNSNGSSNLSIIDPNILGNLNKVKRERYYFRGSEGGTRNYIKYNNNIYQIYYVDTDDTLVLYSENSFGNTFKEKILPISTYSKNKECSCKNDNTVSCMISKGENYYSEVNVNHVDGYMSSICQYYEGDNYYTSWMAFERNYIERKDKIRGYKIHLNNRFKITSGTGDYANPYILEYK